MKTIFWSLSLIWFGLISLSAQELALELPVELKGGRATYPILNEQRQQVCLVLMDNRSAKAYILNQDWKMEQQLSFENMQVMSNLGAAVGHFYTEDAYFVVINDSKTKSYMVLEINLKEGQITYHDRWKFAIPSGEEILTTFSENGSFFVLSVMRDPQTMRLYELNKVGVPKMRVFNIPPDIELSDDNKDTRDLHRYLSNQKLSRSVRFTKLQNNMAASSILNSVKAHKAYFRNDSLLLTIDGVSDATHLITLDLNAQTFHYKYLNYPAIKCTPVEFTTIQTQGNSFLYKNNLFQIQSCPSAAKIGIRNLTDDGFLQEYQISGRDTAIAFRNTPIVLKMERNKKEAKEKILNKPAELLLKINEYNVAISAWENAQGQLEMLVGAHMLYVPQSGGGGMTFMPGSPGFNTPYGAVPGTPGTWVSNPTFGSFRTSGLDRMVHFKSLLAADGTHLDGALQPNAYDHLQEEIEKKFDEKEFSAETIFYFNNAFYFGTYNKDTKQFSIYRYAN